MLKAKIAKLKMILELITIVSASVNISVGCLIFSIYFKLKYIFRNVKMNAEDLLKDIPPDTQDEQQDVQQESKRERLSAIVAGGGSRQYLGRELQLSDTDRMTPQELDKLYCRCEARLGASMTMTLGDYFINLYVMSVSKYFSVINPPKLLEDLEIDTFINHALTSVCCELYYKYGIHLAPFTAMLTTAKHINFNKNKNAIDKNGDPGNPESSGTSENSRTQD